MYVQYDTCNKRILMKFSRFTDECVLSQCLKFRHDRLRRDNTYFKYNDNLKILGKGIHYSNNFYSNLFSPSLVMK